MSLRHSTCHNMGWLPFVGSFKLHVSFAKEPYKRDNILQKRPIRSYTYSNISRIQMYRPIRSCTYSNIFKYIRICQAPARSGAGLFFVVGLLRKRTETKQTYPHAFSSVFIHVFKHVTYSNMPTSSAEQVFSYMQVHFGGVLGHVMYTHIHTRVSKCIRILFRIFEYVSLQRGEFLFVWMRFVCVNDILRRSLVKAYWGNIYIHTRVFSGVFVHVLQLRVAKTHSMPYL